MKKSEKSESEDARILIVDDNPASVMLLERLLNFYGYGSIKTLTDSRMVVETFEQYQPNLLLLDLNMPYLDGFDILSRLNGLEASKCLRVIMMSGQNNTENQKKAFNLGVHEFISKPFTPAAILSMIRNVLKKTTA